MMKNTLGFAMVAAACALLMLLRPTAADPPTPAATVEELVQVIKRLHERIADLEARVEQLEAAAGEAGRTAPPAPNAPVMVITSIEPTEPDPALLERIVELESKAAAEDKAALQAQKEADSYISSATSKSHETSRRRDEENDAKRKACLERASEHRRKAKDFRADATRLQRQIDERGPIIRGWNGTRRVALELIKALPVAVRNILPGEFITWKGTVRQSDGTLEVWSTTSVERASRPAEFKDEQVSP